MPPKKDKKKKKSKKPKRMPVEASFAKFATGMNRQIPGGLIGGGGGGGGGGFSGAITPASFLAAAAQQRQPLPATPIQTPDQFNIIQSQRQQGEAIANIILEQKRAGRRTDKDIAEEKGITVEQLRSERAAKKTEPEPPAMPIGKPKTMKDMAIDMQILQEEYDQFGEQKQLDRMQEIQDFFKMGQQAAQPEEANIRKMRKIKIVGIRPDSISPPEPTTPPVIQSPSFPGGAPARQQGLNMSAPGRLRGSAPDSSSSLVGIEGIGEADVVVAPTGGLQDQGTASGV